MTGIIKRLFRRQKPSYWARIPAEVRYDPKLSASAKLLYGEIDALSKKKGYCWSSNAYFADIYGVTVNTVSGWVQQLVDGDYITSVVRPEDANKRYLSAVPKSTHELLAGGAQTIPEKDDSTIPENDETPIPEKMEGTITENREYNKTSINSSRERTDDPLLPPHLSEAEEIEKLTDIAGGRKLSREESARLAWLNTKAGCPTYITDEFLAFFESEVLDRFNKLAVTDAVLRDWFEKLYDVYGAQASGKAISEHKATSNGWEPKLATVIGLAKDIADKQKKQESSQQAALNAKKREEHTQKEAVAGEKTTDVMGKYRVDGKTIPELEDMAVDFFGNEFQILRCQKQIDKIKYKANKAAYDEAQIP